MNPGFLALGDGKGESLAQEVLEEIWVNRGTVRLYFRCVLWFMRILAWRRPKTLKDVPKLSRRNRLKTVEPPPSYKSAALSLYSRGLVTFCPG